MFLTYKYNEKKQVHMLAWIVYNIWTNLQLFPDSNPSYGYVAVADLREIYIIQHMCFNIYTKRVKNFKKNNIQTQKM